MPWQNVLLCRQKHQLIVVGGTVIFLICIVVVALLLAKNRQHVEMMPENWEGKGTADNLYEIMLGRCYDYITVVNPEVGSKDCRKLSHEFETSVMYKNQCNISAADYQSLMDLGSHPIPCNKTLLWSQTNELVHRYSKTSQNIITLEDTLLGYMANGLYWCGKYYTSGMNYQSCPSWKECKNNPISVFWNMASELFAKQSCGVVHVMLNGSTTTGAIRKDSTFNSIEVPNLDPRRVSEVTLWVMDNIDGPDSDSCGGPTLTELESHLRERNISSSCVDNYWPVRILQCVGNSKNGLCNLTSGTR